MAVTTNEKNGVCVTGGRKAWESVTMGECQHGRVSTWETFNMGDV